MMTEAEIGVMWPQANKCGQPPEFGRWKGQNLPQSLWREHGPNISLISDSQTPEL